MGLVAVAVGGGVCLYSVDYIAFISRCVDVFIHHPLIVIDEIKSYWGERLKMLVLLYDYCKITCNNTLLEEFIYHVTSYIL